MIRACAVIQSCVCSIGPTCFIPFLTNQPECKVCAILLVSSAIAVYGPERTRHARNLDTMCAVTPPIQTRHRRTGQMEQRQKAYRRKKKVHYQDAWLR